MFTWSRVIFGTAETQREYLDSIANMWIDMLLRRCYDVEDSGYCKEDAADAVIGFYPLSFIVFFEFTNLKQAMKIYKM